MGTEENYLDNLLKSITDPESGATEDVMAKEPVSEQISERKEEEVARDEQMDEEMKSIPEPDVTQDAVIEDSANAELPTEPNILDMPDTFDASAVSEELNIEDIPELLDVSDQLEIADIPEELDIPELPEETDTLKIADIPDISEEADVPEELNIPDISEEADALDISDVPEELNISELPEEADALEIADIPEELNIPELSDELEASDAVSESELLETTKLPEAELPDVLEELEASDAEGQPMAEEGIEETALDLGDLQGLEAFEASDEANVNTELDMGDIGDFDIPDIPDIPDAALAEGTDAALDVDEIGEISDISDLDMPELLNETESQLTDELNIDGLKMEETAQSETELGMSDELNLDELDLDASELGTSDTDDDLGILAGMDEEIKDNSVPGVDDGLDDVLSMLDDDADLAEINDILKKSDSNEPIQDEMMDLLNQMADDEAALVNAGVKSIEEDGGVPIPDMPPEAEQADDDSEEQKSSKKKKKGKDGEAKPGAIGKLFNLLTEELPGPTEADYAAEDAKKAAKKQEALTKKEEEKLAKEEEKQAKAAEKEAAKKAKAEAAAQKKKEKQEAKAKKAAEKLAKQGPVKKAKRIPPKKIAAVAVFGASVFGGVIVATNVLSNQGYINVAKKAFYDGNYKEVYLATYGMDLRDSEALIKEKSEVILKMQRWYDSYQNNIKLGREREALDALIRSFETYDYINGEAEEYGVLTEVEAIKGTILDVLQSKYGLGEEQARALLDYEDALDYTMALNNIITGK